MSGGRRTDVLVIALISYRAPSPLLSSSPLPDVSVHRSLGWQWRWLQPLPPPLGKRLVEIESKREKEAEGGRRGREAETERSEERTFAMISLVLLFLRPSLAASLAS